MSRRQAKVLAWMRKTDSLVTFAYPGRNDRTNPRVIFLDRATISPHPNWYVPSIRYSTFQALVNNEMLVPSKTVVSRDKRFGQLYEPTKE